MITQPITGAAREHALATCLRLSESARYIHSLSAALATLFGLENEPGLKVPGGVPPLADLDPDPEPTPAKPQRKAPPTPRETLAAIHAAMPTTTLPHEKPTAGGSQAPTGVELRNRPRASRATRGVADTVIPSMSGAITAAHVAEAAGVSMKNAYAALYRLRAKGVVENCGAGVWKVICR